MLSMELILDNRMAALTEVASSNIGNRGGFAR